MVLLIKVTILEKFERFLTIKDGVLLSVIGMSSNNELNSFYGIHGIVCGQEIDILEKIIKSNYCKLEEIRDINGNIIEISELKG